MTLFNTCDLPVCLITGRMTSAVPNLLLPVYHTVHPCMQQRGQIDFSESSGLQPSS